MLKVILTAYTHEGRRLSLWETCHVYSFTYFTLVVAILDAV